MSFLDKIPRDRRSEILGVLLLALASILFLALVTDGYQGDTRRPIDGVAEVPNGLGWPGAIVAGILTMIVGHAAHVLYFLVAVWGGMLLRHSELDRLTTRLLGALFLTGSIAAMLHIDLARQATLPGGAIGAFIGGRLIFPTFDLIGSNVILLTVALIGILLATDFLFVRWLAILRGAIILLLRAANQVWAFGRRLWQDHRERARERAKTKGSRTAVQREKQSNAIAFRRSVFNREPKKGPGRDPNQIRIRPEPVLNQGGAESPFDAVPSLETIESTASAASAAASQPSAGARKGLPEGHRAGPSKPPEKKETRPAKTELRELPPDFDYPDRYTKPGIDLFDRPAPSKTGDMGDALRHTSVLLEETFETFGIEATVTDVARGPTITRYELEPAPGTKVSRFQALADDVALALKAHRVRVEAPIPGKGRVGIEVPNADREPVVVRELLESEPFCSHKGQLALALGKDITGDVVVTDLATMPHLLVAGATGAGKTLCVKAMLASLLYTRSPEELQLMLVDPKMVELSLFNDIPHLITPVVTDPKKAASALNWLIQEMEERYRLFAHLRARNIEVYNESVENGEITVEKIQGDGQRPVDVIRKLPYIVCVIDELADLMVLVRGEVEDAVARLAQLARAVGIHLIIATQRPSVDVLTGVIKANFPARISFQVSSRVDSRCILDEIGAERLVGKGDMLFLPAGQSKPTRIQGAFVSDDEINNLITYLKTQAPPQYRDEIEKFGKAKEGIQDQDDETDEFFDEAVRVVLETGQASISMVQRRLRVGYTRAARLIDMMEMRGIVGPHIGSKAREILVELPQQDEVV